MNWLLIVTAGILIICALQGYRRGLVRTFAGLLIGVITLILVMLISPQVCSFLREETGLPGYISTRVQSLVWEEAEEQIGEAQIELNTEEKNNLINALPFAPVLKDSILGDEGLGGYAAQSLEYFVIYISDLISDQIVVLIGYVVTFLAVFLILRIAVFLLKILEHLPVLHGLNKIAGLALGLTEGLLGVWILGICLSVFSTTAIGQSAVECISESSFLTTLYDGNLLQQLILWAAG